VTAGLEVDLAAELAVGADTLSETRALQPEVVQGEDDRELVRDRLLDAAGREVEQVMEVDQVGGELVEQLAEDEVDRRVIPALAKLLVVEVVDQLVDADAIVLARVEREVLARDLLLRGEDLDVVPPLDQRPRQVRGVDLGAGGVLGRVAVADQEDLHLRRAYGARPDSQTKALIPRRERRGTR